MEQYKNQKGAELPLIPLRFDVICGALCSDFSPVFILQGSSRGPQLPVTFWAAARARLRASQHPLGAPAPSLKTWRISP